MAAVVGTNTAHAAAVSELPLRHKISQLLADLVKFAVGSAIDGKKHADKMVPEGLINIPLPTPLKTMKKPDLNVAKGIHFETKVEEVEEDMNNIKQMFITSTKRVQESYPPKESNDGFKEINLMKNNGRRVFIRSRL
ncbi:PREDICTED: uncharacterized protein LOC109355114 isoform X2 [Lupinus angustifolius]|uniref:uncharacterized protein LOC109355114 isoform X2 n=1 Tax=Lupinus angustifolius TaxID=3871 RepID=UPI00092F5E84|nr:PREDICTED: uncharacterized protein LOC109355114 isoform X2 [Lupinus angustifolius]